MALTYKNGKELYVKGNATRAEVNAGKVILPARPGRTVTVTGGYMIALGGNAATATSVDIADTAGSPVVAVACGVAGLTQNTVLDFNAASDVTKTTLGRALTADKGLQIIKAGSDLATASSIDYFVRYVIDQ